MGVRCTKVILKISLLVSFTSAAGGGINLLRPKRVDTPPGARKDHTRYPTLPVPTGGFLCMADVLMLVPRTVAEVADAPKLWRRSAASAFAGETYRSGGVSWRVGDKRPPSVSFLSAVGGPALEGKQESSPGL